MARLGICKTETPPYSPEGNLVERTHSVIGNILRADSRHEAHEWPRTLAACTFAFNTTINRNTGMSPYEMLFGQKATLPVDFLFPLKRKEGKSTSNFIEDLKMKYQQVYSKMCQKEQRQVALDGTRHRGHAPLPYQGCLLYTSPSPRD